jgi:hypothetical protein
MSTANITVSDFELTPMRVSFKGPGESAFSDLGGTFGNVLVTMSYKKAPLKADQAGTEPIDHKVSGLEVKVTTTLAEIQNKQKWKIAFPHATKVATAITAVDVSAASPAVVSKTAHGLAVGDSFQFTAGTLPTGASLNTTYYVIAAGFGANSFSFSLTSGGAAVNTTGTAGTGLTITPMSGALVAVDFFTNLGNGGQINAGELLLHPLSKPDLDKSTDYTFYKACAMSASEVTYGPDQQNGLKVEWFIYPDMSNGQKYMRFGDADLV